jgi:hypothetical protein
VPDDAGCSRKPSAASCLIRITSILEDIRFRVRLRLAVAEEMRPQGSVFVDSLKTTQAIRLHQLLDNNPDVVRRALRSVANN